LDCEVFLPERVTDPIELHFHPTKGQTLGAFPFEFSIHGPIKTPSGQTIGRIEANKVYHKHQSRTHWGPDVSETILVGEPTDLQIIRDLPTDSTKKQSEKIECVFWLTPSKVLSPNKIIDRFYTGKVTVKNVHKFSFRLRKGVTVNFDKHFRYINEENNDIVSFPELVATCRLACFEGVKKTSRDLDDFLLLVSFAERHRCICLGWHVCDAISLTRYFRRGIVIPPAEKSHDFDDMLVPPKHFKPFFKTAYHFFAKIEQKDFFRQTIFRVIGREGHTVESSFISLYSAIESLVLIFRSIGGLEYILPDEQKKDFFADTKKYIEQRLPGSKWKKTRKLMYEKIPELNRPSFGTAFEMFCSFYSVDLQGLWPVLGKNVSLSALRNRMVHGDIFSRVQTRALVTAHEHLRWTIERMILAMMEWPISQSNVSNRRLAPMTAYRDLKKDIELLSQ
jgi:hypothetical protein